MAAPGMNCTTVRHAPVHVSIGFAGRQDSGLRVVHLHQLHEEVRLRQAEQGVDGGKMWLIVVVATLQEFPSVTPKMHVAAHGLVRLGEVALQDTTKARPSVSLQLLLLKKGKI